MKRVDPSEDPAFNIPALMASYLQRTGIGSYPDAPVFAKLLPSGRVQTPFKLAADLCRVEKGPEVLDYPRGYRGCRH